MVTKEDALKELAKDRNYEEKISKDLSDYVLIFIDSIEGITPKESEKIKKYIQILIEDTINHANTFNELINFVLKDGQDKY